MLKNDPGKRSSTATDANFGASSKLKPHLLDGALEGFDHMILGASKLPASLLLAGAKQKAAHHALGISALRHSAAR